MSSDHVSAVWRMRGVPAPVKFLMLLCAEYADMDGRYWGTDEHISGLTDMTVLRVARVKEQAQSLGLISLRSGRHCATGEIREFTQLSVVRIESMSVHRDVPGGEIR